MKWTKTRATLFIFTNGEKAEKVYFNHFASILGRAHKGWQIKVVPKKGSPFELVRNALNCSEVDWSEDIVWCVFDKDSFRLEDAVKLSESIDGKKVNLGISVPRFELWYFLHFGIPSENLPSKDYDDKIKDFFIKEKIGDYRKGDDIFYQLYENGRINTAIKNASKLEEGKNPHTNVHELVSFILERISEL